MNPEVTQQPRTPTTEAGSELRDLLAARGITAVERILAIEAEARADLLAQIEKAVLELPGIDTEDRPFSEPFVLREAVLDRIAAIRSAAPVEPE